jgi:multiple sugar transport system ATP-binding protein
MTELVLDHVTKEFADGDETVVAVDDVSLDIGDGEFLVLVGPSGCGKSTTLRMIAGLESVTTGEVRLDGRIINDLPPTERDIAMVFQSYALYPHMTVRGNMRFGLEHSTDLEDAAIDARVEEAAEMMGIADLLDRKPGDLSGGQQQRVALGRAIVRDPAVFLMDEPLSNLDAKLRSRMRTELQRIQEDLGVTTVYVTHDQTEAMTMGDRIAILDGGRLQQVGTPMECYHQPANRFVADFIGEPSMNFLAMEREGEELVGGAFTYPLATDMQRAVGDAHQLTLGIRPEDVVIYADREHDSDVPVTVDVVEPVGDANNVYLLFDEVDRAEGHDLDSVDDAHDDSSLVATVDGLDRIEAGASAFVHLPTDAIHLFDRETGVALRSRHVEDG